ncbi:MAG: spore maturation protein CgeB, partial [Kiritimatiellia bacterium]
QWLADGRLQITIGADLLDYPHRHRELHPTLGAHYRHELRLLDTPQHPTALVVSGTLFFHDLCEALEQNDIAVFSWDVHTADEAELRRTAKRVQARLALAINHTHGLAEACDELGLPLIEWEIDPSTDSLRTTSARSAHVFTWRHSQVERYRRSGYRSSYLPLASNPARRFPTPLTAAEQQDYGVPVAYVGSSMVERGNKLAREFVRWFAKVHPGAANDAASIVQQLLTVQRGQGNRYVVPQMLRQVAPMLEAQFAQAGCPHRPDTLVGEAAAAEYRLRTLAHVAPLGLHVWGDAGWKALENYGATWRGWAGHYHELNRIYSGAAVHVDVGRLYQLDIVPMRIFDVLACGGFVIAEHSDALVECLKPGVEIETWRTPAELVDKVRWYQRNEQARRYLVSAGRARVLREHTIAHRLEHMLANLDALDAALPIAV